MQDKQAPKPNSTIKFEMNGMPIRLWWKIMETAQQKNVSASYFVFRTLAEAVGYNQDGESYDLVLKEIKQVLGQDD